MTLEATAEKTTDISAPIRGRASLELIGEQACCGGLQRTYLHPSVAVGLPMRFSIFLPAQSRHGPVPALFCLAGAEGTEQTFLTAAGAQQHAARAGLILVAPDTIPRREESFEKPDNSGRSRNVGFYVDATETPWRAHHRMYSYVLELHALVCAHFAVRSRCIGITGHAMGGHGALVLALRNPALFRSVSAFAPICSPIFSPWGEEVFPAYLGRNAATWADYDTCALLGRMRTPFPDGILVDQGLADRFLSLYLTPHMLERACRAAAQPLQIRRHAGYGHDYDFVAAFIEDHIRFHIRNMEQR